MTRFTFLLVLSCLLFTIPSMAKGHGGGHGGGHRGGGHSGGYGGYGGPGNNNSSAKNTSRSAGGSSVTHTTLRSRTLPGGYNAPARNLPYINAHHGTTPGYYNPGYREYGSSFPYYYYGYSPFLYDPYFSMFSFGMGAMYSPSYAAGPSNYDPNNNAYNHPAEEGMDGYVIFEHDTISGAVTIKNSAILIETADTSRGYDYKLKMKNSGLASVTVYNDDDKQLNLVRLKDEPKKLWRVVHQGKLNMYDERRDFIYRPEDIDERTLIVVYNGEIVHIHARSQEVATQRLTAFVNKAYGTDLDPKKFSWKGLLVYIDKLN